MIRNEIEYQKSIDRLKLGEESLRKECEALKVQGRTPEVIERVTDPARCFHEQLREEIESYERLKRGDFDELRNLSGLGRLLISLRIFQGMSQRELAEKLEVHESQVSRDERNEYFGVTVERAQRILEALGADLHTHISTKEQKSNSRDSSRLLVGS